MVKRERLPTPTPGPGAWRRTTSAASQQSWPARAVVCPAGANIVRSPVSLRSTVAPRSQPRSARPLPCGGPGTGVRVNPAGVSISPSVGRGAPTPPRPPTAVNNNPCLPPRGKVAPQGRMRGRLPLPPIPGQAVGGGVPDAPRNLPPTAIPRTATRGGVKDPSLRAEPLTGAHANPRAGHARPLPRGGPGTAARVNPTAFPYPHP